MDATAYCLSKAASHDFAHRGRVCSLRKRPFVRDRPDRRAGRQTSAVKSPQTKLSIQKISAVQQEKIDSVGMAAML